MSKIKIGSKLGHLVYKHIYIAWVLYRCTVHGAEKKVEKKKHYRKINFRELCLNNVKGKKKIIHIRRKSLDLKKVSSNLCRQF